MSYRKPTVVQLKALRALHRQDGAGHKWTDAYRMLAGYGVSVTTLLSLKRRGYADSLPCGPYSTRWQITGTGCDVLEAWGQFV